MTDLPNSDFKRSTVVREDTRATVSDNQIREMLDGVFEVYYTRNEDLNREREADKKATIDWLISEYRQGPALGGTRASRPVFTYTFGTSVWVGIKRMVLMCQPDCAICGRPVKEVHHIRPKFLKGTDHPRNVVGLCSECHDQVHRDIDLGIENLLKRTPDLAYFQIPGTKLLIEYDGD